MKLTFSFKEYTPVTINIDEKDITNLNIILGYLNMGAKVIIKSDTEYFMDMSFENKPSSIKDWLKWKWLVLRTSLKCKK